MSNPFSQDSRLGKLKTELGKDKLVLLRFGGTDYVNGLFEFTVDALSDEPNVDLGKIIGTHATIEFITESKEKRFFDGIVTQAAWSGVGESGNMYKLTLRPWFWLLGKRRNQRIFHEKSVVDILTELLEPYSGLGQPALSNKLTQSYPKLEYTVQYRESDLEFACRMMERFGISYFFNHEDGNHALTLVDGMDEYPTIPGGSREYKSVESQHQGGEEHFWEWFPERNFTTGGVRLTDYNFKTPAAMMVVDRMGDAEYASGDLISFDYPGDYLAQGDGKGVVGMRTTQERAGDHRHRAKGDVISISAGMKMTLDGDQVSGVKDQEYLCLMSTHSYVSDAYGTGESGNNEYDFTGEYIFTPVSAPFGPARITRLPVVQGPQTAVVVGDGEIDCDEHGRILVKFHWDLDGAYSMRCRVSQNWASKGWGGMIIPRIGMEVVVEFLEGDPDKPIVTGCVYNGKNTPPYELPANKTVSTFMSDTHQGDGFNELRIEDQKDKEEIFIHGQKDMNTKIEHNLTERVNVNKVETVGHNRANEVTNNAFTVVGGDFSLFVGPSTKGTYTPGDSSSNTQGISAVAEGLGEGGPTGTGILNWTVDKDENVKIGVNQTVEIGSDQKITIGKSQTLEVGTDQSITVSKGRTDSVAKDVSTTIGDNESRSVGKDSSTTVGKTYTLSAGDSITLKCGASSITMKKDGTITIKGKDISIDGSGKITAKSSGNMTLKGSNISQN